MAKKVTMDARRLMEKAVQVMQESVHEPREDRKASPFVGAVLWKPGGTIDTACRGELRDGDHAEYTLLERKNRACRLDGSVLFTTLEPCAPQARKFPKVSCAERIILARIKEVWVGVEDPDPTVDGKGIQHLQANGVKVQMFDRDLQEKIRNVNSGFLDQAMERAAEEEEKQKTAKLSVLEEAVIAVDMNDLSQVALERYREVARIKESIGSSEFNRRLLQQGLLKREKSGYSPTGFGLLLFGKHPRLTMPQAVLLGTIHYPDGTEEPRDFDGPMVLIPGQVEQWLGDKLPNVIDRSKMQRQAVPPLPFEMVREAVVNALVHRDYDIRQAKCQLVVTTDTITVKSPGGPPPPITLEQLQAFDAPMLSRNPELHFVFARMEMAEERGLGIRAIRKRAEELGLPLPKYAWQAPYLALTLYRSPEAATRLLPAEVLDALNKDEKKGWGFLSTRREATRADYERHTGYDTRKAQRHLRRFVNLGLLRESGAGRTTKYEVRGR